MESKADLCRGYIKRFPNTATKTLANIIYKENKAIFKDVESTRSSVRYVRGNFGVKNMAFVKDTGFLKKNGVSGNPFKLPQSEDADFETLNMPKGNNKILLLSDIHLPYHCIESISLAIEYAKKRKVNTVILNGDILDFYQVSFFARDPRKKDFKYELDIAKEFLARLYKALKSPKIYFKQGNHEERYERYMFVKAPELVGVEEFKLNILLEFGKYGIEYIDKKRIIKTGKLSVLHGHEFGRSVYNPVNPARGVYLRAKENAIIGHHHQTSEHTEPTLNGKVLTTWSTGCLCQLNPEYMPINKWNNGFAFIETDSNNFNIHNKRIYKGKIL